VLIAFVSYPPINGAWGLRLAKGAPLLPAMELLHVLKSDAIGALTDIGKIQPREILPLIPLNIP
jgi:hypothetical protein